MQDLDYPSPYITSRELPGCSKKVTEGATFYWCDGMWIAHSVEFFCKDGGRSVTLFPKLIISNCTSMGCKDCPYYTNPEREG